MEPAGTWFHRGDRNCHLILLLTAGNEIGADQNANLADLAVARACELRIRTRWIRDFDTEYPGNHQVLDGCDVGS
jgi:hypothetical protein